MMLSTRRSTSRIDICDYNNLLNREHDTNIIIKKNYFLTKSPPPMSYRDLRLVMSNKVPSNVVILPETSNSSQTVRSHSPNMTTLQNRRKSTHQKKYKRQGIDVYRSLIRTESRCSSLSERDIANDDMMLLANSFIIDHITASPTSGFFHPQNLPNIQKHRTITNNSNHRIGSSHTKSTNPSTSSLRIQHVGHTRPTPPQLTHRTTPVDVQYEENDNKVAITTTTTPIIPLPKTETRTRKQLHVYMPQILSC